MNKKRIAILGSTGSIGTQTLEVVKNHSELFEISFLAAGQNAAFLQQQAQNFGVKTTYLNNLSALSDPNIYKNTDIVVNGIAGLSGLLPTLAVLKSGAKLASANKESIVAAGQFVMQTAKDNKKQIIPIDSEHSAAFQLLESENAAKIILTASGGAFRDKTYDELKNVTAEEALNHPTWKMGKKVTIDCATLVNKALEVIEAMWLFDTKDIEVIIHRQSLIHAILEFKDGSMKASMCLPDMRLPIQYALTAPNRLNCINSIKLDFFKTMSFENPCFLRFPCLGFYKTVLQNPNLGAVLVAADEVAVEQFMQKKIGHFDIYNIINSAMEKFENIKLNSIDDVFRIDKEVKEYLK
jgi:1-deoxy-D-xylulose-5-phosphate reductoisomerase